MKNRANTTKEFLERMRNEPQTAENTFVPIGNYTMVTADKRVFEFPFSDVQDPAYVSQVGWSLAVVG